MSYRCITGNLWRSVLTGLVLLGAISNTHAFSLLGPFTEWMTPEIGYRYQWQAGGPMVLGEEYRRNLPVVTYGFDASFVAFFGEEGVAEVEKAVAVLNDLPPAALINIDAYPKNIYGNNTLAQQGYAYDLKSQALVYLLQQLGLTSSASWAFTIREKSVTSLPYATNYTVVQRNYDPVTRAVSAAINGASVIYTIEEMANGVDASERPTDPLAYWTPGAADVLLGPGIYLKNLSQDDVGGLKYLYSAQNKKFEQLPADVELVGEGTLVNGAIRPGVEKLTFQRVSGVVYPAVSVNVTVEFDDTYISDNITHTQHVRRHLVRPDIVFTAGDLGSYTGTGGFPVIARTSGTTNWINNAALNGFTGSGAGPGVIPPNTEISFSNLLPITAIQQVLNVSQDVLYSLRWGSFTCVEEALTIYPKPAPGTDWNDGIDGRSF